ncbi:hypothetical protein CFN17_13300 [Arthrobacter sp. PM3]|nr:hypothetical protein CFN17_13300 [Arthrobacter sp. PM3]
MCGGHVMSKATGGLLAQFEAKEVVGSPPPSWKVAPTSSLGMGSATDWNCRPPDTPRANRATSCCAVGPAFSASRR